MLRKIKYILIFVICIISLDGCNNDMVPASYRFRLKEIKNAITGCWIEVNMHTKTIPVPETRLSGELIAIQSDTIYILTTLQLCSIPSEKVEDAILYVYKNQAGVYSAATILLFIPNIIAAIAKNEPYFLLLDAPWVFYGTFISFKEGFSDSNLLIYPQKNKVSDFIKFARFPQGIPQGLDKSKLHLLPDSTKRYQR